MKIELYTGEVPRLRFYAALGYSHTVDELPENIVSLIDELEAYCQDNFTPEIILAEQTQRAMQQAAQEAAEAKEKAQRDITEAREQALLSVESVKAESQEKMKTIQAEANDRIQETEERATARIREIEEQNALYREIARELIPEWSPDEVGYKQGDRVWYQDKIYRVLQDHTSQAEWAPDRAPSLYTEGAADGEIPEWKQPTGAHDAYQTGDEVIYNGRIYRSIIDNNSWAPDAYPDGWEEVSA